MWDKSVACPTGPPSLVRGSRRWLPGGIRPSVVIRTVAGMPPSLVVDSLTKRSAPSLLSTVFRSRRRPVASQDWSARRLRQVDHDAGCARPRPSDQGDVRVDGMRYADLTRPLTHVGAVLDAGGVNGGLTGRAHLRWMCRSNRIPKTRIDAVLERVGMSGAANRRVSTYSLGMKQRLGHRRRAAGRSADSRLRRADERSRSRGHGVVAGVPARAAAEGRIVLLSSHLMKELEGIADRL